MNSLSWMIYAADVTGSVGNAINVSAVLTGAALIGVSIGAGIYNFGSPTIWSSDKDPEGTRASWAASATSSLKMAKRLAAGLAALLLIGATIPSSNTIYAIAASEMGEKALNTQTGRKADLALNAWLDRQIAGDKPAKED